MLSKSHMVGSSSTNSPDWLSCGLSGYGCCPGPSSCGADSEGAWLLCVRVRVLHLTQQRWYRLRWLKAAFPLQPARQTEHPGVKSKQQAGSRHGYVHSGAAGF